MGGGDSSQFYLPYFEANLSTSMSSHNFLSFLFINIYFTVKAMQSAGAFVIFFCLIFIICSGVLVQGVRKEYRGLFFPWMTCMGLVIFFQAVYGLWIIIGYYIVSLRNFAMVVIRKLNHIICCFQLWNVFVSICNWLWMAANVSSLTCRILIHSSLNLFISEI